MDHVYAPVGKRRAAVAQDQIAIARCDRVTPLQQVQIQEAALVCGIKLDKHPAKEGWWRRRCCSRCSAMPAHRDGRMHMMELELLHVVQWHASGHYAADCAMFGIVSNNWRALPKWLSEVATAVAIVKEYGTSGVFAAELRAPCRGVDVAEKAELRRADVDILGAVHRAPLPAWAGVNASFRAISL